ncbi:MAG TPA: hypothetical protein PLH77_01495 [Bacilli bacterium]|jgi:hypothetical protein|nr:hypothetical protein [Bacilli bacterium]HPV55163.1 hypothetical protein [Bacilli bacterium]
MMTKKEIDKVVEGSDTDTVKKRKEALDILKKSYGTDGASSEALEKENKTLKDTIASKEEELAKAKESLKEAKADLTKTKSSLKKEKETTKDLKAKNKILEENKVDVKALNSSEPLDNTFYKKLKKDYENLETKSKADKKSLEAKLKASDSELKKQTQVAAKSEQELTEIKKERTNLRRSNTILKNNQDKREAEFASELEQLKKQEEERYLHYREIFLAEVASIQKEKEQLEKQTQEKSSKSKKEIKDLEKSYKQKVKDLETEVETKKKEIKDLEAKLKKQAEDAKQVSNAQIEKLTEEIKASKEALLLYQTQTQAELTKKDDELKKLGEQYNKDLIVKESEKAKLEEKHDSLLLELDKIVLEIKQRQSELDTINQKFDSVTEEDINDLNFKREIEAIRERKAVLKQRSNEEEQTYTNASKLLKIKIQDKRNDIDNDIINIDALERKLEAKKLTLKEKKDLNNQLQNAKYNLDLNRQALVELEKDEPTRIRLRYQKFISDYDGELVALSKAEVALISKYLEARRKEILTAEDKATIKASEAAKKKLEIQLASLEKEKAATDSALQANKSEIESLNKKNEALRIELSLVRNNVDKERIEKLDSRLLELKNKQTSYEVKLEEVNRRVLERSALKQRLITNEQVIHDYYLYNEELKRLFQDYQNNEAKMKRLNSDISYYEEQKLEEEIQKTEYLLKRINLNQDQLYHRMDYIKKQTPALEQDEKVQYYLELIRSIERVNEAKTNLELRVSNTQAQISNLNSYIAEIKGK